MSIALSNETIKSSSVSNRLIILLRTLTILALPLSLSATYITILPTLLLSIISCRYKLTVEFFSGRALRPLVLFIIVGIFTGLFGLRPFYSLQAFFHLLILPASIIIFFRTTESLAKNKIPYLLFLATAFSSLHTLLEGAFPQYFRQLFIGTITEAGQLALIIPLVAGYFYSIYTADNLPNKISRSIKIKTVLLAIFSFVSFLFFGFCAKLNLNIGLCYGLAALVLALFIWQSILATKVLKDFENSHKTLLFNLLVGIGPLLSAALIVNLKRGPWLGVTIALAVFTFIYYRKLILPLVVTAALLALSITPIRDRLEQSSRDFFITGGRSTIWDVGSDLILKYPLGIGYHNSSFLREFAPEIPPELVHFHSNFLNILVEFGWLGFGIFLWWLYELLYLCFKKYPDNPNLPLLRSIGCALISWQIAGLVEYNFGDSEVLFVASLLIALALANAKDVKAQIL